MSEFQGSFLKRAWRLMLPYWRSDEGWMAAALLGVIVLLNLGIVYLNVLFNSWNYDFYNSLQAMDKDAFWKAIIRFSWLAALFIAVNVYNSYLNQMLRIKWRRWMTQRYLGDWLSKQNYYRMQLFGGTMDNPDQRIADDIGQFIQLTLGIALEGLSSVVTLFSFLTILWVHSGPLDFTLHGMAIHIPGYMVWVALVYAVVGTWATFRIGRPLARLNFNQQHYEADFRFSLVRLRENSESVAFYRGEAQEQKNFLSRFSLIVGNWWEIMKRQKKINWFIYGYGQIAIIFPIVVAAPRYFSGAIKLGDLMQTSSAFGHVQGALSYLVNSFTDIAAWKAVTNRLSGFEQSVAQAEVAALPATGFERVTVTEKMIQASDLTLRLPDGKTLLKTINLTVRAGDTLLITGISGTGKSTLLRALAGLWPFVEGKLALPDQARMLFIPQKPYLPLGTLRQALCYPNSPDLPEAEVQEILSLCSLGHLTSRLDETDQWSNTLSLGEQQRVAFARALLTRPDFLFLDETTSALDEAAEANLYGLLKSRLPLSALISVGHRSSLRAFHAQEIKLGTS